MTEWAAAASISAFVLFALVSVLLSIIDIRTHRLPDKIVLPSSAVILTLLVFATLLPSPAVDLGRLFATVGGAALFFIVYLLLALVLRGGLGGGDVKLAPLIGAASGFLGLQTLILSFLLPFAIGAIFTLLLMLFRRVHRRSEVPFGPFMLLGTWASIVCTVCTR